MQNGKALEFLAGEIRLTLEQATGDDSLKECARMLTSEMERVSKITSGLLSRVDDTEYFLAESHAYLMLFGNVVVAWQWLKQGIAAKKALDTGTFPEEFCRSKLQTMRFFYTYELPFNDGFEKIILNDKKLTLKTDKEILM